jgi:hypothetical protein
MDLQLLVSKVTEEASIEAPLRGIYDAINSNIDINNLEDINKACATLFMCNTHATRRAKPTLSVSIKAMDSQIFVMKPYYNLSKFEAEFV